MRKRRLAAVLGAMAARRANGAARGLAATGRINEKTRDGAPAAELAFLQHALWGRGRRGERVAATPSPSCGSVAAAPRIRARVAAAPRSESELGARRRRAADPSERRTRRIRARVAKPADPNERRNRAGLDHYPNYLKRWQDDDIETLERALEGALAKVREQRAALRADCAAVAARAVRICLQAAIEFLSS